MNLKKIIDKWRIKYENIKHRIKQNQITTSRLLPVESTVSGNGWVGSIQLESPKIYLKFSTTEPRCQGFYNQIKLTWSETPSVNDYSVVIFWHEVIIWVTKRNPIDKASMYEVTQDIAIQICSVSDKTFIIDFPWQKSIVIEIATVESPVYIKNVLL